MPLRQTIGISLALLMASASAFANTTEKGSSHLQGQPSTAEPGKSPGRSGKIRLSQKKVRFVHRQSVPAWHRSHRGAAADRFADPQWGHPMNVIGSPEIGQAAWYDLVGSRTSSGERLDAVTATAAHRWLPLGSCAKVTDLDTGRSVIVKINDRGPYRRRFIIDLSPRAAEELGMIHTGTVAVAVEPVEPDDGRSPTEAIYRAAASDTMQ
jgi:rare lipoprotein A (peptidoglycan hydrolase)